MSVRIRIVRWTDRRPQRWRNGGGITYELLSDPAGASIDLFEWRISVAEVASDGPFSVFEGVDRTLVLLEGEMELNVDGVRQTLGGMHSQLSFDGGSHTSARLICGATRDLNVMTRRANLQHAVARWERGALAPATAHWLVFASESGLAVAIDDKVVTLDRFDLLEGRGAPADLVVGGPCWFIQIKPRNESA